MPPLKSIGVVHMQTAYGRALVLFAGLLLACPLGCGGESSDGSLSSSDLDRAERLAAAGCALVQKCAPLLQSFYYSSLSDCERAEAQNAQVELFSKGVNTWPDQIDACVISTQNATCDDLYQQRIAECTGSGTLPNGEACVDGNQCQSGSCNKADNSICGVCGRRAELGESCATSSCASGLNCVEDICRRPVDQGQACSSWLECKPPFTCVAGTCQAPVAAGEPCSSALECDFLGGFSCNSTLNVCQAIQFAGTGEPCGTVNDRLVMCGGNAKCHKPANGQPGTCSRVVAEGEACSADAENDGGATCRRPSVCENGFCRQPAFDSCR
jgi:hypothetical protein